MVLLVSLILMKMMRSQHTTVVLCLISLDGWTFDHVGGDIRITAHEFRHNFSAFSAFSAFHDTHDSCDGTDDEM